MNSLIIKQLVIHSSKIGMMNLRVQNQFDLPTIHSGEIRASATWITGTESDLSLKINDMR